MPLQAYGITSIRTMYMHQRNHLCSKISNIKHKRTQTIINSHRNAKRKFFWGDGSYPPTKVKGKKGKGSGFI